MHQGRPTAARLASEVKREKKNEQRNGLQGPRVLPNPQDDWHPTLTAYPFRGGDHSESVIHADTPAVHQLQHLQASSTLPLYELAAICRLKKWTSKVRVRVHFIVAVESAEFIEPIANRSHGVKVGLVVTAAEYCERFPSWAFLLMPSISGIVNLCATRPTCEPVLLTKTNADIGISFSLSTVCDDVVKEAFEGCTMALKYKPSVDGSVYNRSTRTARTRYCEYNAAI